jgi:hypothetical protein
VNLLPLSPRRICIAVAPFTAPGGSILPDNDVRDSHPQPIGEDLIFARDVL